MGNEAKCTARFKGKSAEGTARLETDVLQFRSPDLKLAVPFKTMREVTATKGALTVKMPDGVLSLQLGAPAEKWVDKIRNPPSRLQKLGAKPDWRVSVLGVDDQDFLRELEKAVGFLSVGRVARNSDAIFFGATKTAQLDRLDALKRRDQAKWRHLDRPSQGPSRDSGSRSDGCRQNSRAG
ncbi:MAG TPA: hypothetical protein VH583_14750 [Vicinamibacterales bacterium]|jgi:hypothetical protein